MNVFDRFAEDVRVATDKYMEGALEIMGVHVKEMIQKQLVENGSVDDGKLFTSIMWATSQAMDRSEGDAPPIRVPDKKGVLHVGTADPKAPYVEYGSGPHKQHAEQGPEFEENIRDWASRHGWMAKDGGELKISDVWNLIQSIRARGTTEQPFMRPVVADLAGGSAKAAMNSYLANLLRAEFGKIPKQKTVIDVNVQF